MMSPHYRVGQLTWRAGIAVSLGHIDRDLELEISEIMDELAADRPYGWEMLLFKVTDAGADMRVLRRMAA